MYKSVYHRDFSSEWKFSAVRSSGAGGQNVNKVNTRVELRFPIAKSQQLSENEKNLLYKKLKNRINSENELILSCQSERSQLRNKQKVIERFFDILAESLKQEKHRIATKRTNASRLKRIESKKLQASKKERRKPPML